MPIPVTAGVGHLCPSIPVAAGVNAIGPPLHQQGQTIISDQSLLLPKGGGEITDTSKVAMVITLQVLK